MSDAADQEIRDLDAALTADGEDVVLRRVVGSSTATQVFNNVTCRAFVRGFSPSELNASITQQDSKVVLSPTQINTAQWPGGQPVQSGQFQADPRIPNKNRGDLCFIGGRRHSVEAAKGIFMGDTLIRIDMVVRAVA